MIRLDVVGSNLVVHAPFEIKDFLKKIPTHRWDKSSKVWLFDITRQDALVGIAQFLERVGGMYRIVPTPAAEQVLSRAREAMVRVTDGVARIDAIKLGAVDVSQVAMPIKTVPYQHQKVGFSIATSVDAVGLFMEMGTGKTLVAIGAAGERYAAGEIQKLLVVAPLSVVDVWEREFKKHAAFPYDIQVVRGGKIPEFGDGLQVAITNYDQLVQRGGKEGTFDVVKKWKPDMMILDESQRIKNREAKRSQAIHELAEDVRYRLILTGTPVTQNVLDLWSQYYFLDKGVFGDNWYAFRGRYAIMGGWEGKEVIGYRNVTEVSEKALKVAYRVTKADALDLPPYVDELLYCELEPDTRAHYEKMKRDAMLVMEGVGSSHAPLVLTQLLRLGQMAGGFLTIKPEDGEGTEVRQIGSEKLTVLREFIDDFPKDKKLVIFCRFLAEIDAIMKMLSSMKISAESLTGATRERGKQIDRFQYGESPRVLVVQMSTGGLGIDLWRADTEVFFSYGYSFADYDQARARVHRVGQKNNVTYVHLIAKDTVDEAIIDALERKGDVAKAVVDRILNTEMYDEEKGTMMVKYRKKEKERQ
jgi:SNF2 family DNA or RNA helicase